MRSALVLSCVVLSCAMTPAQVRWSAGNPASRPTPRDQFALVHLANSYRVLLFGGELAAGLSNETWLFDGSNWRQSLASGPTARSGMAAAYDNLRSGAVLFSGWDGTGYAHDTWHYAPGTDTWTNVTPPVQPLPREWSGAAYFPRRFQVLLFGGRNRNAGSGMLGDTWGFDGRTWTRHAPSSSPSPRWGHSMVFFPADRPWFSEVLLFGGQVQGGLSNELWAWNGSTWSRRPTATSPPARAFASMTYDDLRGRVVLSGGLVGGAPANDAWEYDGVDWRLRTPVGAVLPARSRSEMEYFRVVEANVVFGGSTRSGKVGDTWVYGPVTPARGDAFGSSCVGSGSPPTLLCDLRAWVGDEYRVALRSPPFGLAVFFFGLSDQRTSWGAPLPLALMPFGIPCTLFVDPMWSRTVRPPGTTTVMRLAVPAIPSLVGTTLFSQGGLLDPSYPGGFVTSNACRHVLGGR